MKTEILVDFQICIRVPLNALSQMFMERKIWNFLSKSQPYSYHNLAEACNFIKKESLARVFSCEFCEISKNTFFAEHLRTTAVGNIIIFSSDYFHPLFYDGKINNGLAYTL